MIVNKNPFLAVTFISIWLKHFYNNLASYRFRFIDIQFIKSKIFPIYINVGRNTTNGMSYELFDENNISDFKKKVFLIYDVPTYFSIASPKSSKLKIKYINQYDGVLTNISSYTTFDDYMQRAFRSKKRNAFKRNKSRLESDFNITYSIYYGNISDDEYEGLANNLKNLIVKRFSLLKRSNAIIDTWEYNFEMMKEMIRSKLAMVIFINRDNIPIAMNFNFLSDEILFYAVTTFDADYEKYKLGHVNIMQAIEWCFENNLKIFDFSKGESEYKSRWSNEKYSFQCHVLYDSGSFYTTIIANVISSYFKFKQYLRKVGVNILYSKLTYVMKR